MDFQCQFVVEVTRSSLINKLAALPCWLLPPLNGLISDVRARPANVLLADRPRHGGSLSIALWAAPEFYNHVYNILIYTYFVQ